ncbi:molybdenum cofactor biosynthesis protein MoaE [soil metagenome]
MTRLVALTTEPIDVAAVIAAVARADAGGIDLFLGVVRDANDGKPVTLLEYEAYAPMANAEMDRIASEVEASFDGVRVAVVHRVGALRIGDVAVVCAASAPHRGEAFAACRKLIDEIKHRVPIWKREHGPEGAYWVGWVDARCDHAAPI